MSNEVNKDWSHWIRESDEAATISGTGAKRQTKSGGKTKVDTSPDMKPSNAQVAYDQKGTKGYDRSNRPNDSRPSSINFDKQSYAPSNPAHDVKGRIASMWTGAIKRDVDNRERSRRLQRPG